MAGTHARPSRDSMLTDAYSDLSIFQNTGVAGPSSTPVSDFRQALGARYCPSGM